MLRTALTRWHTRRARVRNAMRSWFEYRWTRNREFIRNEQIFLRLSMKIFPREPIYRLSNLIISFYQNSQKRWMSINNLRSGSRHLNIHYQETSMNAYQLSSIEYYRLIVLIIYMIHYLTSADIYMKSVVQRE
jgi:hypothetical protein